LTKFNFSLAGGGEVMLLNTDDIRRVLDMATCVEVVESVFRRLAEGAAPQPAAVSFDAGPGHFHVKAGLSGDGYYVAKVNANYPANPKLGLPTIQGLVMLSSAVDGRVLAVLDSAELTARRTGAATAVAVRHLAVQRPLAVTLCGCGRQAVAQLTAVAAVRPIAQAYVCDRDPAAAHRLVVELADEIAIEAFALDDLRARARQSDVVITCTPSRQPILGPGDVEAGCLVAAVGADNPHKQEIHPELLRASKVVVDVLDQCVLMGDVHHAIASCVLTRADVHAELGEIVTGKKTGRSNDDEIIVFDSTGIALQDVAAAAAVYERVMSDVPLT
jgi:alanine dehydrogenase